MWNDQKAIWSALDSRLRWTFLFAVASTPILAAAELTVIAFVFGYFGSILSDGSASESPISNWIELITLPMIALIIAARFLITLVHQRLKASATFGIHNCLSVVFFTNGFRAGLFSGVSAQQLVRILGIEIGQVNAFYNLAFQIMLDGAITFFFFAALVAILGIQTIIVLPVVVLIGLFPIWVVGNVAKKLGRRRITAEDERQLSIATFIANVSVHLGVPRQHHEDERNFLARNGNLMSIGSHSLFVSNLTKPILDVIFLLVIVILIIFSSSSDGISTEAAFIAVAGALRVFPAVTKMAASINGAIGLLPAVRMVVEAIGTRSPGMPIFSAKLPESLVFEPPCLQWSEVTSDLVMRAQVEPCRLSDGDSIQLVGPSGVGKSIFLRQLAAICATRCHDDIMYVAVTDQLPPGNLIDSLSFGKKIPEDSLRKSLDLAEVDFEIDVQIDRSGAGLSDGQRARALLARALLLKPKIMILDEILTVIDARRRQKIIPAIIRETRERGAFLIVVSHSSIKELRKCEIKQPY